MPVVHRLYRLHRLEQEGVGAVRARCLLVGEDDIVDRHRLAVAEFGVLAQREGVDELVLGDLPGFGQARLQALAGGIRLDQGVADLLDRPDRAVVGRDERIVSVRPLDEVTDLAVLHEIAPIRSFVESSLKELSCEELDVVFWKDKSGVLKVILRGPDDVVSLAKSSIGDRAAIPPTQH
jgi:hypothetical protein